MKTKFNEKKAVRSLLSLYSKTLKKTREDGSRWYDNAGIVARSLASSQEQGAGIIAALSPNQLWSQNVKTARELAADPVNSPRRTFGDCDRKARKIALGASPAAVLSGSKVRAFARAMNGHRGSVVIDRWALRAAGSNKSKVTAKQYDEFAGAYRTAASAVHVTPREFQAITWIAIRGSNL